MTQPSVDPMLSEIINCNPSATLTWPIFWCIDNSSVVPKRTFDCVLVLNDDDSFVLKQLYEFFPVFVTERCRNRRNTRITTLLCRYRVCYTFCDKKSIVVTDLINTKYWFRCLNVIA
ncbi:hypothetical protein C497_05687 [Halalkalicoccus jeotgali B3]|uniref:Uncharacterized protein n=1 Tax=Halalkalicoccus jeotgali (strain DSM 18796 / CECT 7217 / JCM 14584 / KCTC 4019 / B3) TaxID=795797 RepID=L9VT34_HALJB|nr:hypothetical protein C497_05687 [Halalkalicoccus jeotgali B3]